MIRIASLEAELSKLRTQIASYALRQEDIEPHQQGERCPTLYMPGSYRLAWAHTRTFGLLPCHRLCMLVESVKTVSPAQTVPTTLLICCFCLTGAPVAPPPPPLSLPPPAPPPPPLTTNTPRLESAKVCKGRKCTLHSTVVQANINLGDMVLLLCVCLFAHPPPFR